MHHRQDPSDSQDYCLSKQTQMQPLLIERGEDLVKFKGVYGLQEGLSYIASQHNAHPTTAPLLIMLNSQATSYSQNP
jgi:hypothetical protein